MKSAVQIKESSPLYDFWQSDQSNKDELIRIEKASKKNTSILFLEEPYKWEILYQSIVKEIREGDNSSIKGLIILLEMLNEEQRAKTIKVFGQENILSEYSLNLIRQKKGIDSTSKKNILRFIRILIAIFSNPYSIDLKRQKNHVYEYTGFYMQSIRRWLKKLTISH